MERFQKEVGFSIARKNKKVKEILSSYTEVDYGRSFEDAKEKVTKMQEKGIEINTKNLMKERKCAHRTAMDLLKWLRGENIIKKISGGHKKGHHGYTLHQYELIK